MDKVVSGGSAFLSLMHSMRHIYEDVDRICEASYGRSRTRALLAKAAAWKRYSSILRWMDTFEKNGHDLFFRHSFSVNCCARTLNKFIENKRGYIKTSHAVTFYKKFFIKQKFF